MADKKISALTGASTPLAGTEVLPIVQGGATVNVSVANLTAGRAVAMAGGSFTDNITQSTAAKGVNFTANTPAAGMTSQLLNWYEEGTWTPTFYGSGTAGTYTPSVFKATYTKVGRLVTARADFNFSAASGGTGNVRLAGLPFNYSGQSAMPAVVSTSSVDTTTASGLGVFVNQASSGTSAELFMYQCLDATTQEQVPISGISTSSRITFILSYEV